MAGLGTYAFKKKGYKNVATVAEDYSFPYTRCSASWPSSARPAAHVTSKSWVPIGNKDFSSVIAAIPADVDAVYVALGGADGVNFLTQYQQAGGTAPLIGGSITADQTVLSSQGQAEGRRPRHASPPARSPTPGTTRTGRSSSRPTRRCSRTASRARRCSPMATTSTPRRCCSRSTRSTATSPTAARSSARRCPSLEFDTPTGPVKLDANRNAIANIFVTEVVEGDDGTLFNKVVKVARRRGPDARRRRRRSF